MCKCCVMGRAGTLRGVFFSADMTVLVLMIVLAAVLRCYLFKADWNSVFLIISPVLSTLAFILAKIYAVVASVCAYKPAFLRTDSSTA